MTMFLLLYLLSKVLAQFTQIFGPKRDEVTEVGENCIKRRFITCTLRQV
jgi:hypothetical protein